MIDQKIEQSWSRFACYIGGGTTLKEDCIFLDNVRGPLKIKRAAISGLDINLLEGVPIIAHIPLPVWLEACECMNCQELLEERSSWFVLPVRWQLGYAMSGMYIALNKLTSPEIFNIPLHNLGIEFPKTMGQPLSAKNPEELREYCIQALKEARDPVLRTGIQAIHAARNAAANAVIGAIRDNFTENEIAPITMKG